MTLSITICICSLKRTSLISLLNSIYTQDFDHLFIITGNQLGRQRNLGALKCSTDLFVTIDDDCIAHPDFIQKGRELFEKNPEIDFAQGRIMGGLNTSEHFTFITANLWMRTKMIKDVEFNEELHGCEDLDMCWRALDLGYKYKYNPDCIAYHIPDKNFNTLEGQCNEDVEKLAYYMKVHPERTMILFKEDKHVFTPISEWKWKVNL